MDWHLDKDGTELARVLNFTPAAERAKVFTRLLDGSCLAQTIGDVTERAAVTLLVNSMEQLRAVNRAEAECALLTLRYRGTDYQGYLVDKPKWTPVIRGSVYTGAVTFAEAT